MEKKLIKNILRWISILPLSFLGMFLSYALSKIINTLTTSRYIDPDSWLNIIFIEIISNLLSGAAFVFIGFKVAPNKQKIVAIILTILYFLISCISIYITNFITKEYLDNIGLISGIIGSIACYISIHKEEIN
jgi:hypothetical protein